MSWPINVSKLTNTGAPAGNTKAHEASSGMAVASATTPAIGRHDASKRRLRRTQVHHTSRKGLGHIKKAKGPLDHDTKIAAPAAEGSEQIRIVIVVGGRDNLARCRQHHSGSHHGITGKAGLAAQIAGATREG